MGEPPVQGTKPDGDPRGGGRRPAPRSRVAGVLSLAALLMVTPALLVTISESSTEPLKVGVMLTQDAHAGMADLAASGIEHTYDDAEIELMTLVPRLNLSGFETRSGDRGLQYDTEEFNDPDLTEGLRVEHGVDLLVFVTGRDISRFGDDLNFLAGSSSVASLSAVISYNRFVSAGGEVVIDGLLEERVEKLAAHEFGHLLGFTHRMDGSVMTYRPAGEDVSLNSRELSGADAASLDIRVAVLKAYAGAGMQTGDIQGLNMLVAAVQLPIFAGIVLVAALALRSLVAGDRKRLVPAGVLGVLLAYFALLLGSPEWGAGLAVAGPLVVALFGRVEALDGEYYSYRVNWLGLIEWTAAGIFLGVAVVFVRLAPEYTGFEEALAGMDTAVLADLLGVMILVLAVKAALDLRDVSRDEKAGGEEGGGKRRGGKRGRKFPGRKGSRKA